MWENKGKRNRKVNQQESFFGRKNAKTENILKRYTNPRQHTVLLLKGVIICEQKKQDPDTAESALSRHRCVPKIAFRETIKRKHTTALHKPGGEPILGNGPPDVEIPYLQSPLCSQTGV